MKNYFSLLLALAAGWATPAAAQTLFILGKDTITVSQFLRAYEKNNTGKDPKGIKGYRDLYIAARLKVAEARALGLDTTAQFLADFRGLREQILPTYLNDEEAISARIEEAFARGRKDIRLSHIFISAGGDSARASRRAAEASQELKEGKSFAEVARRYSDDPSVALNGGDAGWVTVFTLPYGLENLLYATKPGTLSHPFRSRAGYHIFKNEGEAPAAGRVRAAQILIAFPPGAATGARSAAKRLADSLYGALGKGSDFGTLASRFSNDVVSAASGGAMPEFGRGGYDPKFEKEVFALAKDGAISKPFETEFGWHIVKRMKRLPPPTVLDENTRAALRDKVLQSDWVKVREEALVQKVLRLVPFSNASFGPEALWKMTDSILGSPSPLVRDTSRNLGRMGEKWITLAQWVEWARVERFSGGTQRGYADLFWNSFIPEQALQFYKDHLENFSPLFRTQMEEFGEGNLFFEIMQQKVWGPAQGDTAALRKWYEGHSARYQWGKSADAVLFYAADESSAARFRKALSGSPAEWRAHMSPYSDKIAGDSGRFELAALPNGAAAPLKAGSITPVLLNKGDSTVSFAYIIRLYPEGGQRSFEEAKGLVTGDYGEALEAAWVEDLKAKYGVVVNEAAWAALLQRQ